MQLYIPLFLVLVIFVGAFGYMSYHYEAKRRAQNKRRNQYHDRV